MKTFFKENRKFLFYLVIIVTFAYCLPKIFVCCVIDSTLWGEYSETGAIGDTFGGLSAPLIGTINIILLYMTLKRQNELEKKQDEFNRSQISNQKEEQFKSVFFQLLQRQHDMYKEVQGTFQSRFMREYLRGSQMRTVSGIDYFKVAKHELKAVFDVLEKKAENSIKTLIVNEYNITDEVIGQYNGLQTNKEKMAFAYKCFFDRHYELSSCHRHLYHILKFIKAEEDSYRNFLFKGQKQKANGKNFTYKRFADILQASLTDDELLLAYYNCACFAKTEKLVLYFQFVENLRKEDLFNPSRDIIEGIKIKNKD